MRLDGGHDADGRVVRKVDVPEGHGLDGGHRPKQQVHKATRHLHGGGLQQTGTPLPVGGSLFNFALLYNFYDVMFLLYHRTSITAAERWRKLLQNERVEQRSFVSLAPLSDALSTWARVHIQQMRGGARHVKGKETLLPGG